MLLRNESVLISLWFDYLVYSVVSVNSVVISLWGWTLFGVIVGNFRVTSYRASDSITERNCSAPLRTIFTISALITLLFISLGKSEFDFLRYARQSNGDAITESVTSWPQDSRRIQWVAQGWINSGNHERARALPIFGLSHNPQHFTFWKLFSQLPDITISEKKKAEMALKKLDPKGLEQ